MKLIKLLSSAILGIGLLCLGSAPAQAADVTLPAGTYSFNTLAAGDGGVDNSIYEISGNLTLQAGAIIQCNDPADPNTDSACAITIVVSGKMLMEATSAITADNNFDGGNAGNITITVGTDMTMCGPNGGQPGCASPGAGNGALISAQKKSGGTTSVVNSVTITVGDKTKATGNFYMEGGVTTYGLETGAKIDTASGTGHAGNITVTAGSTYFTEPGSVVQAGFPLAPPTATAQGGKIFLVADCTLTSQGRVTSKAPDFGADLVHLESCTVLIEGLVESTGKGHASDSPNSCDNINDGLPGEVLRDHPAESTGCVEVWGNIITIDSFNTNPAPGGSLWAGELNADIGDGGPEGTSWIDIFANSSLTVIDGTGNDFVRDNFGHTYFSTYAVHANAVDGSDLNPAVVTAKVKSGPLTAGSDGTAGSGRAFEASSTMTAATGHVDPGFVGNGSHGGTIDLEASGAVTLDNAWVNASGDFDAVGGHILVSAWGTGSNLSWQNGDGDVQNNATGDIKLNACGGTITTTGTNFHGEVPTLTNNCDLTKPDIPDITPANAGPVFKSDLWALCGSSSVGGIKFNDLDGSHVRDGSPLEPVLGGWVITLWNAAQTVVVATTSTAAPPDGSYSFTGVAPGTYVICETLQAGWSQTAPVAGLGVVACINPGAAPLGYQVIVTGAGATCTGEQITGKDFGNRLQLKGSKSGRKFNDLLGDGIDQPTDPGLNGWVIHLFGTETLGANIHLTQATHTAAAADATCTLGAAGCYYFGGLNPGTYHVCEERQTGWTQTYPASGFNCVGADPALDNPTPGPTGYTFTIVGGDDHTGNDFGNFKRQDCKKQTAIDIMNNAFPLNSGPDFTVHTDAGEQIQPVVDGAYDFNGDGYVIIMVIAHADGSLGGSANQKVVVSKDYTALTESNYPFGLIGCSVTLTGGGSDPAVWIKDTAKGKLTTINGRPTTILVADLHGGNSAVGVEADGTLHYLRNEGASNNGTGIKVLGNNNTVHNGAAGSNHGDGVYVRGDYNLLTDTNSMSNSNGGNGFNVEGSHNQLLKLDAGEKGTGNSGDGVKVAGDSNTLSEIDAYANGGDGIDVAGNGNTLTKNVAGDKNKGNGSGIRVLGFSNTLTENKASANTGNGFTISGGLNGTANLLKNNVSNTGNSGDLTLENGGPEYSLLNYVKNNGGGNKADNITIPKTTSPTKCTGFPATNLTANFAVANNCE